MLGAAALGSRRRQGDSRPMNHRGREQRGEEVRGRKEEGRSVKKKQVKERRGVAREERLRETNKVAIRGGEGRVIRTRGSERETHEKGEDRAKQDRREEGESGTGERVNGLPRPCEPPDHTGRAATTRPLQHPSSASWPGTRLPTGKQLAYRTPTWPIARFPAPILPQLSSLNPSNRYFFSPAPVSAYALFNQLSICCRRRRRSLWSVVFERRSLLDLASSGSFRLFSRSTRGSTARVGLANVQTSLFFWNIGGSSDARGWKAETVDEFSRGVMSRARLAHARGGTTIEATMML